ITITSDNIIQLAPDAPENIKNNVQKWLQKNPNYSATTLGYESFVPTEQREHEGKMYWTIRPLVEKTNSMLEEYKTPNMSPFNYVHEFCKDRTWLIKIAGHINRKYNISHLAQAFK